MTVGRLLIDHNSDYISGDTREDPVIELWYNHSKKHYISDTGAQNVYTSYFWLRNKLTIPITLNGVQITTGETPTEPIVDAALQDPATGLWKDFISFSDPGILAPNTWTHRYQFTMKIIRAIDGPPLPEDYINSVYFYPSYNVDYKNTDQFKYDVSVIKMN
ncbi:MAG: hypothetical protein QNJ36_01895 [Calothrix sp. MO_167.B42]|nr:hypothetical protein [Calothrix sp. MO_167.B42]